MQLYVLLKISDIVQCRGDEINDKIDVDMIFDKDSLEIGDLEHILKAKYANICR